VGIFNNPNDVARIAMVGILACMYCAGLRKDLIGKLRWVPMIAVQVWAMVLTYSRGGFLGLLAGIGMLGALRFGRTKTIMASIIVLPALLLVSSGRFNFDASSGTGQERILLWRDAFEDMKSSPIFGIGIGEFGGDEGLVAHNSFMQCFTEMGMFGGTVYTGAFYMALWGLWRLKPQMIPDAEQRRERVYVLAILAAAVMGMFSSTRILREDTYMLLGLATVFLGFSAWYAPQLSLRVNLQLAKRLIVVSLITLIMFNIYVRLEAH
jgi:O-antigen ligase